MSKTIKLLAAVFVLTFAIGASLVDSQAAACRFKCICGTSYKCCTTNGVETCKPAAGIQCPQVAC